VIDGLVHCIRPEIASGYALQRIYVYSVFDSHKMPSRHMQRKAVDISRINGVRVFAGYLDRGPVKAIVDAIQTSFESYVHRRENFGPLFKKKSGRDWVVAGHQDHIHLSVD
jgi:hypothetical protein